MAAMKKGILRKLVVGAAIGSTILSFVLVSNGQIGARLSAKPVADMIMQDLRVRLAEETLSAASDSPWLGRGLGVFETVFPQVTDSALPELNILHPESDVLWLLFEGGILALIPCVVLSFWLMTSSGPWFSHHRKKSHEGRSGRRIRKAFGVAAFLVIAHAVADVPLHGLGFCVTFALIVSFAVRPRYSGSRIPKWQSLTFRLIGLSVTVFGGYWLLIINGVVGGNLAVTAPVMYDRAIVESAEGKRAAALHSVTRAIEHSPLDFRLYFLRAQLKLTLRAGTEAALLDFGRARAVEPRYSLVCLDEGQFWLHFDPKMALIPWREGLRRYSTDFPAKLWRYTVIVSNLQSFPDLHLAIWRLADELPLQLICINQFMHSPHWAVVRDEFLAEHTGLVQLNDPQVLYFLDAWNNGGEQSQLLDYVKKIPRLSKLAWRLISRDLARQGQFEGAFRIAARHIEAPARSATLSSADIPRLERVHLMSPLDVLSGVELYYAQRAGNDLKRARLTLEKVMQLATSPSFLRREYASLLADEGDFRGAWELMRQMMEAMPSESSVQGAEAHIDDNIQRPSAPEPRPLGAEL